MPVPTARDPKANSTLARRFRLGILAAAILSAAAPARAAHDTDVATAADPDRPIEVDLDVDYTHLRSDTLITRENFQAVNPAQPNGAKSTVLVNELQHSQVDDQMALRLAIGLYHDLELHFVLPYSFGDTQNWDYATVNGTSVAATSTLTNNTINVSGCNGGLCGPVQSILPKSFTSSPTSSASTKRGGFGDPTIGLAWAVLNEERDSRLRPDLFPPGHALSTWVLGFDYTLPLPGDLDDPSKQLAAINASSTGNAAASYTGSLLRKAHIFSPWTAWSIRYHVLNPYFSLRATLPLAVSGSAYDNCSDPALLADVATQNCGNAAWAGQTGYQPAFTGQFKLGSEFVLAEDVQEHRKIALDLNGVVTWISQARDYSMVSDLLGKLTLEDEHVTTIGTFGIYGRAARWLHFRVSGSLGFDTPHFLTNEDIGKDLNGDGKITISAGGPNKSLEQNPLYDFRLDQVGRRLHAEMSLIWGVSGTVSLNF